MQYPHRFGRRRSFVRYISCILLPLRPAPRIFFHTVKNPSCQVEGVYICHKGETPHSPEYRKIEQFSRSGSSCRPDLLEFEPAPILKECDDEGVTQKLDNLEKELQELRQQMARIMAAQLKPEPYSERTDVVCAQQSSQFLAPPPPPLPPPPPPMLPMNVNPVSRLVITRAEKPVHTSTPKRPAGAVDMADVLKDLGKVKLRRVERSPGGTPVRQRPPSSDPNTMLLLALKKRYAVMHDVTPEKCMRSRDRCSTSDSSLSEGNSFHSPVLKC